MRAVLFELPHPGPTGGAPVDGLIAALLEALGEGARAAVRQVSSYRGRPGLLLELPPEQLEAACEQVRSLLWDAEVDFVEHLYFQAPQAVPGAPTASTSTSQAPAPLQGEPTPSRRDPAHEAWRAGLVARKLAAGRAFCRMDLHARARSQFLAARHLDPASPEVAFELGAVDLHLGALEEAERWLREAVSLDAGQGRFHELLGTVCHRGGRLDEAQAHLIRAVECQPDEASSFEALGWVFLDQGDHPRAASAFQEALSLQPGMVSALSGLGSVHFSEGRLEEAVEALQGALEEEPGCEVARLQLGWCLFQQGALDQAEEAFLQVLHGQGGELLAPTAFGLGRLYLRRGNLPLAVEAFQRAAGEPWPPASWMLGEALFLSDRFDEARAALEQALALDPGLAGEVETRLALCCLKVGRLDEAEGWLHRDLERRGPHGATLELLGVVHGSRGDWERASEVLRQAVGLEPDCAPAWFQLGWAAEHLGDLEEARACYLRALRLDPDSLAAATHLGWLFLDDDRTGEAAVVFERALEAHPEDPELLYAMGRTLFCEGRHDRAAALLRRSLGQRPESAEARAWLGAALVSLGEAEEGRRELRRVLREVGPDEETRALCRRYLRTRSRHRGPAGSGRGSAAVLQRVG